MIKLTDYLYKGCETDCLCYMFSCPACFEKEQEGILSYHHIHVFYINCKSMPYWKFDGNLEQPTFDPSLLLKVYDPDDNKKLLSCCHLNIIKGKIHYHEDCTHNMARKIVDMIPYVTE